MGRSYSSEEMQAVHSTAPADWTRKTEFRPVKFGLKIGLMLHPAHAEGLVNIYAYIYNTSTNHILEGEGQGKFQRVG